MLNTQRSNSPYYAIKAAEIVLKSMRAERPHPLPLLRRRPPQQRPQQLRRLPQQRLLQQLRRLPQRKHIQRIRRQPQQKRLQQLRRLPQ
ncbi:hypothetical protein V3C99_004591 [Haemonchus contortus]